MRENGRYGAKQLATASVSIYTVVYKCTVVDIRAIIIIIIIILRPHTARDSSVAPR